MSNRFGILARWLLEFEGRNAYFWSGDENIVIEGREYIGVGNILQMGSAESSIGSQNNRLTVSIAATNPEVRRVMVADTRLYIVIISWVVSVDGGQTFRKTKRQFRGSTSNAVYSNGVYTVELEPTLGDVDRKRPRKWSDENHRERYPKDVGFSYLASLVDGVRKARFPG